MKLFLGTLGCLMVATLGAPLENTYLPPNGASGSTENGNLLNAEYGTPENGKYTEAQDLSASAQSADARAGILRFDNENNGDGSYSFAYETENQISHRESGELRNANTEDEAIAVHGSYSYVGPDGITYTVNYVADENGFRATGEHLPTSPPIPEEILKSLEQNETEESSQQQGYPATGDFNHQQEYQDAGVVESAKYQVPQNSNRQDHGNGHGNYNGNDNKNDNGNGNRNDSSNYNGNDNGNGNRSENGNGNNEGYRY